MKINEQEIQAIAVAQPSPRLDLYAGIHKALRALMANTLLAVGRMDPEDMTDTLATSARVLELLDFCALHVANENEFVHAAIEARAPGASDAIAHEHDVHLAQIARLKTTLASLSESWCGRT